MQLVMLSSVSVGSDHANRRAAPIDYFLTKPVRQSDLYDAISTAMSLARIQSADPPVSPALRYAPAQLGGRVLVAEDNPVNQQVAAAMLESLGVAFCMATNGIEAVERISRDSFDLVLMDCQMPEMDGFEATAEIRRCQREGSLRSSLPVIALTANAVEGDRERCLAAGMNDYLSKPFTREQLAAILERWLPDRGPAHSDVGRGGKSPARHVGEVRSAPGTRAEGPINPRALDTIRSLPGANGASIISRVIRAYLDDTPPRMADLHAAVRAGNAEQLRKAAHGLKSSSANVGAEGLAATCKTLELLSRGGTVDGAEPLLASAEEELARVFAALETQLDENSQHALA
jgi:CheY-like chemotaxis protein/HPt (histidine-containing phosphotransfer) domain-containing protein